VRTALAAIGGSADLQVVAAAFAGKRTQKRLCEVGETLEMLAEWGQVVGVENGRYAVG
jgi:hypothetical protein